MALPLKSGADLYTQELLRARLHNFDGDLNEYGIGSIYINTTTGLNTSNRIRYRGRSAWHSVANLEDIARLEGIINSLDFAGSADFTGLVDRMTAAESDIDSLEGRAATAESDIDSLEGRMANAEGDIDTLEGRVETIEDDYLTASDKRELSDLIATIQGYFTNGDANNALRFGGQLPSYYAQSSVLSQLRTEFDALYRTLNDDTSGVINTWQEVVDFVNEFSGSEDLSTILAGMNTKIDNRYTKAEIDTMLSAYRLLTDGVFDVLVEANNGIETNEITIGGIRLSVVDGQLCIDGDAFTTGELSAGGIGEEGGAGSGSGILVLEDWDGYDATLNQVVSAALGLGLRDRIATAEGTLATHTADIESLGSRIATAEGTLATHTADIESLGSRIDALASQATNVSVSQTLTSGREIGAITIDGTATKLYAPASYAWEDISGKTSAKLITLLGYTPYDSASFTRANIKSTLGISDWALASSKPSYSWSEITSKPTTLAGYGITDAYTASAVNTKLAGYLPLTGGTISGQLSVTSNAFFGAGNEGIYISASGQDIAWHNASNQYVALLMRFTSSSVLAYRDIVPGYNNLYSLGTSSNQWLTIYGVNGVFSGALTVGGGATITGDVTINGYTPITSGNIGSQSVNYATSAGSATRLATTRTIWGQSFDGTGDVSGDLALPLDAKLYWVDKDFYYIGASRTLSSGAPNIDYAAYSGHVFRTASDTIRMIISSSGNVTIGSSNLAGASYKLYVDGTGIFTGALSTNGALTVGGGATITGDVTINGDALIPTGHTLRIGDATLSWDSTSNALKVDTDFYSDGELSAGGAAEEGGSSSIGGSGLERVTFTIPSGTTTFDCEHNLGTREISVAIYEEGNDYQQILTDVYLDSDNIARIVFGSATDVAHKVVIIG